MFNRYSMILVAVLTLAFTSSALATDPVIQVIHNSPSAGAEVVDIYLNGGDSPAIPDFGFRQATGMVSLPMGSYEIGIAPGNSSGPEDIIATFGPYMLENDTKTVIMAAGELGVDFGLFVNELVTMAPGGEVGLLAFHGAPDAPTVDVGADGVGILIPGLEYLTFAGYLNVPAANYVLTIAPTGEEPIIAFEAPLSGFDGGTAVAFASGYLGMAPNFGLFVALNDGTVIELQTTVNNEEMSWSDMKASYR